MEKIWRPNQVTLTFDDQEVMCNTEIDGSVYALLHRLGVEFEYVGFGRSFATRMMIQRSPRRDSRGVDGYEPRPPVWWCPTFVLPMHSVLIEVKRPGTGLARFQRKIVSAFLPSNQARRYNLYLCTEKVEQEFDTIQRFLDSLYLVHDRVEHPAHPCHLKAS